jgi:hypothetical protein
MATKSSSYKKEFLKRLYFSVRNNKLIYPNVVNFKQKKSLSSFDFHISDVQKRILNDLKTNGISIVGFNELFDTSVLNEMLDWIVKNETNLTAKLKKKYLFSYFGTDDKDLALDVSNPFVKFYLSDEVLEIASSYLNYIPQLFEVYVEKTMPVGSDTPSHSQNWHRDPEEKKTLKVFIYLSDVTEESGPFTYVLGSSPTGTGKYKNLFPQKLPHGSYPSEKDVTGEVNLNDLLIATGVRGSIIFCDTSGLHRGGYARSEHRIMSTGFYPSKHYSEHPRFSVKDLNNLSKTTISPLARKVLGISNS